ncbi:GerAB/ArcD/ProY family transporter [Evansella sp. AB-rgal1]|uniref:GerAB/ArcD/ProY family transporter n=1 Tax=Evansella sp. AB-rgal1 TaxID=3242696 RepID=UPI00359E0DBF
MDKGKIKKLNKYHVIFLVDKSIAGIALFSLPYFLRHVGVNMWMVLLMFGILATLLLYPMVQLCKKYPNHSLFVMNEKLLGKYIGKLLNFFILIYVTLQVANESKFYVRLVQAITLPDFTITPITLALFFVMTMIVNGGIKSIARFCILAWFLTMWLGYYSYWAFSDANFLHLVPRFDKSLQDWGLAFFEGSQLMLGFALIMFFFPYIQNQKKSFKHATIGIWIGIVLMLLISVASIVYFSEWQIENLLYPLLNLFQAVELSNVERIETFGISIYVLSTLAKASLLLWVAKKGVDALFSKHKNKTRHLYLMTGICLFIVLGPIPIRYQKIMYEEWIIYGGYCLISLPILLLFIHKIRNRKEASTQ